MVQHRFQPQSSHSQAPNVILITTDQQRGDCLGLEHPIVQTPFVDALARQGCYFRHGYTEHPICIPARRTLMSGATANAHGAYTNYESWLDLPTLPEVLSRAHYQTQLCGKLHLWPYRKNYGFENMLLQDGPGFGPEDDGDYLAFLRDQGVPGAFPQMAGGVSPWCGHKNWHLDERLHVTNWTTETAINFLERRDPTRPFFLNINYFFPHPPLTPLPEYYERYLGILNDLPAEDWLPQASSAWRSRFAGGFELSPQQHKQFAAAYYASINHIDDQLQRLWNVMSRLPYIDVQNTMVVFISDHGEMLGDQRMLGKSVPYQASVRVPYIIKPARCMAIPRGQVIDTAVGIADLMPTILDCVGVTVPDDLQAERAAISPNDLGQSLLPLMQPNGDATFDRRYVHGELSSSHGFLNARSGFQYLTDGRRKYIWYPAVGDHDQAGLEQFFDLEADPSETTDLIDHPDYQSEIAAMRANLMQRLVGREEGFTDGTQWQRLDGPTRRHRPAIVRDTDKYREGIHYSSRDDDTFRQYEPV